MAYEIWLSNYCSLQLINWLSSLYLEGHFPVYCSEGYTSWLWQTRNVICSCVVLVWYCFMLLFMACLMTRAKSCYIIGAIGLNNQKL
jgi:hypothetical protein